MAKDSYPYKMPLTLTPGAGADLDLVAKIRNSSKAALVREYVVAGLRADLAAHHARVKAAQKGKRQGAEGD